MKEEDTKRGIYGKYILSKADGSEVDPEACYFVLRLDTDPAARAAALEYARKCDNEELAKDICVCVHVLSKKPCGCRSVGECFHGLYDDHVVWRHGGTNDHEKDRKEETL